MSNILKELRYAATHEWARLDDEGLVWVGISDHAQNALGDVVFVDLPEIGRQLSQGEEASVVESVKAASDVYAPVAGEVVSVNAALLDNPELVNTDAYASWFFCLQPSDPAEFDKLLSADDYAAACDAEA